MTDYRTHGYDIVAEFSESTLSSFFPLIASDILSRCNGRYEDISTEIGAVTGNCSFFPVLTGASLDFDAPGSNRVHLALPFNLNPSFSSPSELSDTDNYQGTVRVTCEIRVATIGSNRCISFDFSSISTADVRVREISNIDPAAMEEYRGALTDFLEGALYTGLHDRVDHYDIREFCIGVTPGGDPNNPFAPTEVELRTLTDAARNSLALMISTDSPPSGGDAASLSTVLGRSNDFVVTLGNELFLHRFMANQFIEGLEIPDPDNPGEFSRAADLKIPDPDNPGEFVVSRYGLFNFSDSQTRLKGPVSVAHLIDVSWIDSARLMDCTISITDDEQVEVNAHIRVTGLWSNIVGDVSLHFYGPIDMRSDNIAVLHWHVDEPDVDIYISPSVWVLSFLLLGEWGLITVGSVWAGVLQPLAEGFIWGLMENDIFSDCTVVSHAEWSEEATAVEIDCYIDLNQLLPIPLDFDIDHMILDDWALIGSVSLPVPEFVAPEASLEIIGEMEVADDVVTTMRPGRSPFGWVQHTILTITQSHEGLFFASHFMMVNPVTYYWSLAGESIGGESTITVDGTVVSYNINDDVCELSLEPGNSLETEISVTAIDDNGLELFASKSISAQGEIELDSFVGEELPDPSTLHELPFSLVEETERPEEELIETRTVFSVSTQPVFAMSEDEYQTSCRVALERGMDIRLSDIPRHK